MLQISKFKKEDSEPLVGKSEMMLEFWCSTSVGASFAEQLKKISLPGLPQ